MKKKNLLFATLLLLVTTLCSVFAKAQSDTPDKILGKWINEEKNRTIEFMKNGDSYYAVIRQAPDAAMVGKNQLSDLKYGKGTYSGKVWLLKTGKNYNCTVKIKTESTLEITAKAGLMSKSQTWTRVK